MPRKTARTNTPKNQSPRQSKPRTSIAASSALKPGLSYFEERQQAMVETVRQFVEAESPTDNKQYADGLASLLAGPFEGLSGHSMYHPLEAFGNHLLVEFPERRGGKPM